MRSLTLRIYLTVLAALALFALVSGWLLQQHLGQERERFAGAARERAAAWGELLQRSLPGPEASAADQAEALEDWSRRLRLPLALDDARGVRIGASSSYRQRADEPDAERQPALAIALDDGRTLWLLRPGPRRPPGARGPAGDGPRRAARALDEWPLGLPPGGVGLVALLLVLFAAVAAGAWPVARRLTRRLDALQRGVEAFGAGELAKRVDEDGGDEVGALGASFNRAAARIEALLRSHQSLLANASHELRSPLARLKMAVEMLDDAAPAQREPLRHEIRTDIGELDALVEELLMASRLDAGEAALADDRVDLLALAAEEAARHHVDVDGRTAWVRGDERLLRRALRNLLENARRYGGDEIAVVVDARADGHAEVCVLDRGPGVPPQFRERIFEPFFRLPGHAEHAGGVGLGLSLVRQIAQRHGGSVDCEARDGGGSRFCLRLPSA